MASGPEPFAAVLSGGHPAEQLLLHRSCQHLQQGRQEQQHHDAPARSPGQGVPDAPLVLHCSPRRVQEGRPRCRRPADPECDVPQLCQGRHLTFQHGHRSLWQRREPSRCGKGAAPHESSGHAARFRMLQGGDWGMQRWRLDPQGHGIAAGDGAEGPGAPCRVLPPRDLRLRPRQPLGAVPGPAAGNAPAGPAARRPCVRRGHAGVQLHGPLAIGIGAVARAGGAREASE
mmetsp:Transcript_132005/g.368015  ORF Transcript_132005/g.368015 Transcript_132005/m.368015 type:complete len:230 (-) Transcript_132005:484-1173(-)